MADDVAPDLAASTDPDRLAWIERIAADLHLGHCVVPGCDEANDDDRNAAAIIWQIAKTDPDKGTTGWLCDRIMRHMARIAWPDDPSPLEEQGYEAGSHLDGMSIWDWRDTANMATRRVSDAEREAGRTVDEHMRRWLPEVKDRVLHPYPRPEKYDKAAVIRVFSEIEREIDERLSHG